MPKLGRKSWVRPRVSPHRAVVVNGRAHILDRVNLIQGLPSHYTYTPKGGWVCGADDTGLGVLWDTGLGVPDVSTIGRHLMVQPSPQENGPGDGYYKAYDTVSGLW
ncbi:hypothetical protein KIPB_013476 [Kipferlia bialata]|uniref:Uncharacterized protein n=1 Tax=Kipferlia bialata TaxID=797122 RepID=A0A9K3D7H9_9EUKA|nr:hypothetical protein KIPB_013476 [Kipferlia bialata]|eukprot:g13476.t1